MDDADRLTGWKEIGQYLRRSPRSVQRWERELLLPVKRAKTAHGLVVYASRSELDAWMARFNALPPDVPEGPHPEDHPHDETDAGPSSVPAGLDPPEDRRDQRPWVFALMAVVLVASLVLAWGLPGWTSTVPAGVAVFSRVAEGRDANGRRLWTHTFDEDVMLIDLNEPPSSLPEEVDLNGDSVTEWLVPIRFGTGINDRKRTDMLYAFTATGDVLWSATLPSEQSLSCGGETIGGPWQITAVAVSGGGTKTVWAAFSHHTKRPSMVLEISPGGRQRIRYIQAGWVMGLTEWMTADGPMLAAVGVINERARASLVTLDPSHHLTVLPGGSYTCDAPGAVPPWSATLFPPQDLTAAYGYPYYLATGVSAMGDALKVNLSGSLAQAWVEADGRVSEISFNDDYRLTHDELFRRGRLTHRIDACPTLHGDRDVEVWTAERGWDRYIVPAKSARVP